MGESNGMKVMYMVWGWLLLLTIVEVVLAYFQVTPTLMLIILIGLSLIKAVLINHSDSDVVLHRGDRVAQLLILSVPTWDLVEVDVLDESARGESGFGSTGT